MGTDELKFCWLFTVIIGIIVVIATADISCRNGRDSGRSKENERWERLMIEKGIGTYETSPISEYTKFKFKEQINVKE